MRGFVLARARRAQNVGPRLKSVSRPIYLDLTHFRKSFQQSRFHFETSVPRKNEVPEGICHVQSVRSSLEFGHIWVHTCTIPITSTNPFLGRFRKIALYAVTSATSGSYSNSFAVALLTVFRSLLVVPRRFRFKLRLH